MTGTDHHTALKIIMAATSTGILFSDATISAPSISNVRIHPLAIFQMGDSYLRAQACRSKRGPSVTGSKESTWDGIGKDAKEEEKDNSRGSYGVGVLYGNIVDNTAIVLDSFACVPREGTTVDRELFQKMRTRHREMFPKEEVIGYYTFGQKKVEWNDIIPDGSYGIHIWVTPLSPPKIDVFCISRHGKSLMFLPIEYTIEASAEEQMGLSRLADQSVKGIHEKESSGSRQAAVRKLSSLLNNVGSFCASSDNHKKDNLTGRRIYVAIQQAKMSENSHSILKENIAGINNFVQELSYSDEVVSSAESKLSLPLE